MSDRHTDERPSPPRAIAGARPGLLGKLNGLVIGLIVATAIAVTAFSVWGQLHDDTVDLQERGAALAAVLAEVGRQPIAAGNIEPIDRALRSLPADGDVAYVVVSDARGQPLAVRAFGGHEVPADGARAPGDAGGATVAEIAARKQRYLETRRVVLAPDTADVVAGEVRVGMSYGWVHDHIVRSMLRALSVVAVLLTIAIAATLFLTRRLVKPIRTLTDAAEQVAQGRLEVRVPATTSDEIGALATTFNRMTEQLASTRAEVAESQRTLEQKVAQRTRELEAATARAYKLAQHDILTGLPNRALLDERLKQILAQAQREGQHVACLFLDFDHFKRINDTLGHDAGDALLKLVAQRLTTAVRETDTLARLGGDEFVVVLPGLDPAHAEHVVTTILERIRETFSQTVPVADQDVVMSCSIGVSVYPYDALDPGSLIKQADTAMYAAKEEGRNTYRFYTADMNARIQARLQLETSMRRGLSKGEFDLAFQPQIDMATSWPVGVEALLRWNDPNRGPVPPSEFIPIAEESGLIHQLGGWALAEACRRVVAWHRRDMPLRLSVNVSVQQLQHENWIVLVERALAESGLPPRYLDLEITESVIITHPEKAVTTLMRLRQIGVTTTIDDFGTGYSSLSYLARLPIHAVKIDQRFVRGLDQNRNDEAITQAIIALAHSLGLRVIAEGIESAPQYAFLKAHGCAEGQGFYIAKPLLESELIDWWNEHAETKQVIQTAPAYWKHKT